MRLTRFKRITLQAADSQSAGTHAHVTLVCYITQQILFDRCKHHLKVFTDYYTACRNAQKRTFPDFSENVLYISVIFVLHTCCICVAYRLKSNTSDNFPQPL